MIAKIKKSIQDRKLNKIIKDQLLEIETLKSALNRSLELVDQNQISIGQLQNRCYQLQVGKDAYRTSQALCLELFKNLLRQETQLFKDANSGWIEQINVLKEQVTNLMIRINFIENSGHD
jgi:hypothetical protein